VAVSVPNGEDLETKPEIVLDGAVNPAFLQTQDLVVGAGQTAEYRHTVLVQYVGVLGRDGTEFDSSWGRGGQPVSFPLDGVIPGFRNGIAGMQEGGRRVISMPPSDGYGEHGAPPVIGPNEPLVFVVDLLKVS
jgi:FKBP-type peptidyl-prolyl cis-trans isomerase